MDIKSISVEELNKLVDLALVAPTSKFSAILNSFKLILAASFIIARHLLVKELKEKENWEHKKKQLNKLDADLEVSDIF